jgi:hypothetical protein
MKEEDLPQNAPFGGSVAGVGCHGGPVGEGRPRKGYPPGYSGLREKELDTAIFTGISTGRLTSMHSRKKCLYLGSWIAARDYRRK